MCGGRNVTPPPNRDVEAGYRPVSRLARAKGHPGTHNGTTGSASRKTGAEEVVLAEVVPASSDKGKRGGLRVIYYVTLRDGRVRLLTSVERRENVPAHGTLPNSLWRRPMNIEQFLERVAKEIHDLYLKGDNQSTTTVCFYSGTGTLYVATQGDKLALQQLLQPPKNAAKHAGLRDLVPKATSGGYKKLKIDAHREPAEEDLPTIWQIVDKLSRAHGYYAPLHAGNIAAVKWVTRFDLLCEGAKLQGTGFHGESYIIRYMALKGLHGVQALVSGVGEFEEEQATPKLIKALCSHFRDVYENRLFMASSQGACSTCAAFMKSLGIRFDAIQDRDTDRVDTWVHPFTMTTEQSGFRRYNGSKFWIAPKLLEIKGAKEKKAAGNQ